MPLLAMGEHWDPTVPPLLPIQQPPVLRDPIAKPKVKAYMGVGGANRGLRAPADAARQPPPPPPPPNVIGGAPGVRVASVPILPARGGNVPARVAVVKTPPPPPPLVGATPPHAVRGGKVPSLVPPVGKAPACGSVGACSVLYTRRWAPRARKRISWNCLLASARASVGSSCASWSSSPEAGF